MRKILLSILIGLMCVCAFGLTACQEAEKECLHDNEQNSTIITATCSQTGLERTTCEDCGKTLSEQSLQKLPHTASEWKTISNASCSQNGVKQKTCVDCGVVLETEEIAKVNHTASEWIVDSDANCKDKGLQHKECSECKAILDVDIVSDLYDHKNYVYGECELCGAIDSTYMTEGLIYSLINAGSEYEISGYVGESADVIIPAIYKGKPVTSIGRSAFSECTSITSVVIPNSVTSIGYMAFDYCPLLTSVVIPISVITIGSYAFSGEKIIYCEATERPEGWDYDWYEGNGLAIVWDCNNNDIAEDGNIYVVEDRIIYAIAEGEASLIRVPRAAMQATILSSITYKGNDYIVTSVDEYAFEYCSSLKSLTIPNTLKEMDVYFYDCTSLTTVNYLGTINEWIKLGMAGRLDEEYNLYLNGELVTEIEITSLTEISSGAFYNCKSLVSVVIPNSVTSIGSSAFYYCTSLTSIEIPNSVTSIGDYAFSGCDSLNYYIKDGLKYLGNSNNPYLYLARVVDIRITTATIDNNCSFIRSSAFSGCTSLTSIVLSNSVTSIGSYAFSSCSRLTNIMLPNNVTSIGDSAFYNCTSLTICCQAQSKPSGWNSGWNYSNRPVVWGAELDVESGLLYTLINEDTGYEVYGYVGTSTEVVIPSTYNGKPVTNIGYYAFEYCSSLTSVTIGNSVTSIGSSAFYNCYRLTSVVFEENSQLTSIGDYAFYYCTSLTSIEIPDSVTSIGSYAFSGCSKLTSIEIPDSVTSIGSYAFYNCSSLTIWCQAQSKPSDWNSYWNHSVCPVVWGYQGDN